MIERNGYNRLLEHGIKPSMQRVAIMDYLIANPVHPTVDTIFSALSPQMPTLSRMTVYNTLNLLLEHQAVRQLTIDEKQSRYDAELAPHAHFRCEVCGAIYDVPMPLAAPCAFPDFEVSEMQIYYKGLCKECKQKRNK